MEERSIWISGRPYLFLSAFDSDSSRPQLLTEILGPSLLLFCRNYERYLDVTLSRNHNLTTGKVYQAVIEKERRGDYLGKTVQVR